MRSEVRSQIAEVKSVYFCNLTSDLTEARALDLTEVLACHLHDAAHLVEAGTHGLADSVTESIIPGAFSAFEKSSERFVRLGQHFRGWFVREVGSDDGGAAIVVTRVQD